MLETLCTIKSDLEQTAAHLEGLSIAMRGHLTYLDKRGGHVDGVDVLGHITSITSSAVSLRSLASRLEAPAAIDVDVLHQVMLHLQSEAPACEPATTLPA